MMNDGLTLLIEEASEVIQACTKIQRFGPNSSHPLHPDGRPNNMDCLIQEIGDVLKIAQLLGISKQQLDDAIKRKHDKMVSLGIISECGMIL